MAKRPSSVTSSSASSFRAPVLAYLMLGEAIELLRGSEEVGAEQRWDRMSDALDVVWYKRLDDYERLALNYDTRIAVAEDLGEVTC